MNSSRLGPSEIKFFLSGDRELFKRQLHDKAFLSSWKKESKKSLRNRHQLLQSFQELLWLRSGWLCITRFARQRPDETHLQTLQARHCSKSSEIYSYEKLRFWFSIKNFKQLTALLTEKKYLGFNCRTRFIVAILNKTLHNNAVPVFLFRSHLLAGYPVLILIGDGVPGMFEFFSEKVVALPPPGMD